jgi:hypothetical protein
MAVRSNEYVELKQKGTKIKTFSRDKRQYTYKVSAGEKALIFFSSCTDTYMTINSI